VSQRSLVEINHDYCPHNDDKALLAWARKIQTYIGSGCPADLPDGIEVKWRRHHSDPCPFDEPTEFQRRFPRSRKGVKP
jgi:hypothetical protein